MGNSLWQLVLQSDRVSQLVLLMLLAMSIVCWTIFFYKLVLLRLKHKHLRAATERIKSIKNLEELLLIAPEFKGTIPGFFFSKNLSYLKSLLESSNELGSHEWDLVQQHMYQTVDTIVEHEESILPLLSTSAAVSPLLGLFGTVWGLVHAFIRISERQMADITTVAPGIAEALITTLAGLMVAIPALVMYNYVNVQIRKLEQLCIHLAEKVGLIIQQRIAR